MITYSEPFIAFLKQSTCKIARALYNAHLSRHPAYRLMVTTGAVNYLAAKGSSDISFLPANKNPTDDDDDVWDLSSRQYGRPAKMIRKVFAKNALDLFTDADFEQFANAFKCYFTEIHQFTLLPNYAIPEVYNMDRESCSASLGDSCMNHYGARMGIYKKCAVLRILVLLSPNERLCGRALVWHFEKQGITLMDRIYVTEEYMYDMFIAYATENGWWRKKHYKTYDHRTIFVKPDDTLTTKRLKVATPTDFHSYPYIDTFCYGDDGFLYNYDKGPYFFNSIDGARENREWDAISECYRNQGECLTINAGTRAGVRTHIENIVSIATGIYWRQDPDIVELSDGSYHQLVDTVFSIYNNVRFLRSRCVWSVHHDSYILESEAVFINSGYYHVNAEVANRLIA